jgi:flagellar capping protein FliD
MPAPTTLSYVDYVASGVTATFGVTIPYLAKADITVTVNGTPVTFTWLNNSTVLLNSTPAGGAAVRITRTTPIAVALVTEQDGSVLSAEDLNEQDLQNLYLIQELKEKVDSLQAQLNSLVVLAGNLPTVTTGDNGKILQVVSGVWTLVATNTLTIMDDFQVDGVNLKLQKKTVPLVTIGATPSISAWTDAHTGTAC